MADIVVIGAGQAGVLEAILAAELGPCTALVVFPAIMARNRGKMGVGDRKSVV